MGAYKESIEPHVIDTVLKLRRKGYTPAAIRMFAERIGVAKRDSVVDLALLEFCIREDLNKQALRVMGVLNPVKLVIDNYHEGEDEMLEAITKLEPLEKEYAKIDKTLKSLPKDDEAATGARRYHRS